MLARTMAYLGILSTICVWFVIIQVVPRIGARPTGVSTSSPVTVISPTWTTTGDAAAAGGDADAMPSFVGAGGYHRPSEASHQPAPCEASLIRPPSSVSQNSGRCRALPMAVVIAVARCTVIGFTF